MKKWIACVAFVAASITVCAQYSLQRFNINPQSGWGKGSNPAGFTSFKGKTYFFANDGVNGRKIWSCDGSSLTMEPAKGNMSLSYNSVGPEMRAAGNFLFYAAYDMQYGTELHQYDGVQSQVAVNMASGSSAGRPNSSAPRHFTSVNNRLYFHGGYWGMFGIWMYDPNTTTANHLLDYKDIGGISFNTGIFSFGDKLIVTADDSLTWTEPYEVEIQTGNFRRLGDINPGKASSNSQGFVVYKDLLFFVAVSATTGRELYLYDGSGTPVRLTDIAAGTGHSFVYGGVGGLGSKVYFTAKDTSGIYDLYSYDILSKKVKLEFVLQSYNAAAEFVVYGNKLFFSMGYSLMMFDGLTAPVDIASLNLGLPIANPQYLAVSNGRLFFSASNQGGEEELYMLTDSMALEVPEERLTGGAHVYPNPASTKAHISFTLASAAKLTVRLTDIQGRILHTITKQYNAGKQEIALPVQELATGIYIYSLMDAEGTVLGRGKLTKQ